MSRAVAYWHDLRANTYSIIQCLDWNDFFLCKFRYVFPVPIRELQRAYWASYCHLIFNNQEHHHHFCPKGGGGNSWCLYKRAIALELPESARGYEKKLFLAKTPMKKLECIKSVYRKLLNQNFLKRCLKGVTQNTNESLYFKVWIKCQKIVLSPLEGYVPGPTYSTGTKLLVYRWKHHTTYLRV